MKTSPAIHPPKSGNDSRSITDSFEPNFEWVIVRHQSAHDQHDATHRRLGNGHAGDSVGVCLRRQRRTDRKHQSEGA